MKHKKVIVYYFWTLFYFAMAEGIWDIEADDIKKQLRGGKVFEE